MIQSDMISLTPISLSDEELFINIYTDPKVMANVGPVFTKKTAMKMFYQCVNQTTKEQPSNILYVIKNRENNQKYGLIGLLWNQPEKDSVELGVMISRSFINKAYAIKAINKLINKAFIEFELNSIVVLCSNINIIANRVASGLKFEEAGKFFDKSNCQIKTIWKMDKRKYLKMHIL